MVLAQMPAWVSLLLRHPVKRGKSDKISNPNFRIQKKFE
jgi:hypothetical protein